MNTKVKGDKIKEGSIPLSALDNTITEVIPYIKYNADPIVINIKKGVTEYNLGRYVNFGNYFKFNNIIHPIENQNNFYTNLSGPSITGSIEHREASYLILGSAPIIDQTILLYPHIYVNKIKKEFLPDDIGGADWNAQEGEAGYIENKPDIDPVVWKYLCNPIGIYIGGDVPTELLGEFVEGDGAYIMPKLVPGMIKCVYIRFDGIIKPILPANVSNQDSVNSATIDVYLTEEDASHIDNDSGEGMYMVYADRNKKWKIELI